MSILCIALAVLLVTALFGMADMFVRAQILDAKRRYGDFHVAIKAVTDEQAAQIAALDDVRLAVRYDVYNYQLDKGLTLGGKGICIIGCDEKWTTEIEQDILCEGRFPQSTKEALLVESVKDQLGLRVGDECEIARLGGEPLRYTISGFFSNASKTLVEDVYGACVTLEAYDAIDPTPSRALYIQFANPYRARQGVRVLKERAGIPEDQITENTALMGLYGQSGARLMLFVYASAGVLLVLVLSAGAMMIAGSLSSGVAQKTSYYGLLRCIGATQKQVMRLVRREALGWCRVAIPVGVGMGTLLIWALCAVLRRLSPEYFGTMPAFAVSLPGLLSGIIVGLLTVVVASRAPARRAARVSPLAAASGGAAAVGGAQITGPASGLRGRMELALGVRHATSSHRNLLLTSGLFAMSVTLFLAFSVPVDFIHHALMGLQPWTADISVNSPDQTREISHALVERLQENPVVRAAFGRMHAYDLPAEAGDSAFRADLISYEEKQLAWSKRYLIEGDLRAVGNEDLTALAVYDGKTPLACGDTVRLCTESGDKTVRIVGVISDCPLLNLADRTQLICSEQTFMELMGTSGYSVVDVQLTGKESEADVRAMRALAGERFVFSDKRADNANVRGAYWSFCLFVFGFLVLIALITVFGVVNCVAMSAAARTRLCGLMRAVGMSARQAADMILAEACVYALLGGVAGVALGLPLNALLFDWLIAERWGETWAVPWGQMAVILSIVAAAVALAAAGPVRRLKNLSIIESIAAQ